MTDSDWASAFRPNNANQPAVPTLRLKPWLPSPAAQFDCAPIVPNEQGWRLVLSSVAEMFMLEQRTESR